MSKLLIYGGIKNEENVKYIYISFSRKFTGNKYLRLYYHIGYHSLQSTFRSNLEPHIYFSWKTV